MKTCQFCLKDDLNDQATKCPHCGAWLDETGQTSSQFDELGKDLREQLRKDRQDYQDYMKSIFNRVQIAASIVLALAIGAATWFGFRTDESITEITHGITARIEEQFESVKTRDAINGAITKVAEKMAPAIERQVVDGALEEARTALESFNQSVEGARVEIAAIKAGATSSWDELKGTIGSIKEQVEPLQAQLREIEHVATRTKDAFVDAVKAPVSGTLAPLPMEFVAPDPKSGLEEISRLIAKRTTALSFQLGQGGYYGPVIWLYFENLSKLPGFRYVVLLNQDGSLFGVLEAPALVAALNPPNAGDLAKQHPLESSSFPSENEVPKWSEFAALLRDDDRSALSALPAFISGKEAVSSGSDQREVLEHMEQLSVDWLPVVDEAREKFIGVTDRSRLTAGLLLEIAKRIQTAP